MSNNCVSFEKTPFVKDVAQFGGEDKARICLSKLVNVILPQ
jgi:hypothetical protein